MGETTSGTKAARRRVAVLGVAGVLVLVGGGCVSVQRANVGAGGAQSAGAASAPAISADGQVVAFVSSASDLVPGDTNGVADVFVHDFAGGTTERVSTVAGGGETLYPADTFALSPDGRYVAFEALLGELVPGSFPPVALRPWVGVHDRQSGVTDLAATPTAELVEVAAPQYLDSGSLSTRQTDVGVGPTSFRVTEHGLCRAAAQVSGDGRWCVETVTPESAPPSEGPGLLVQAPGTGPGGARVLDTEITIDGAVPDAALTGLAVSRTGRFVAFTSAATNHWPADRNGLADAFVVDRDPDGNGVFDEQAALPMRRVSRPIGGPGDPDGASSAPAISADGRFVVFVSEASNLVAGDTNGVADVFRFDRSNGTTERVSVVDGGGQSNGPSGAVAVSADATRAAFVSSASNLVAGDTNGVADAFRWAQAPSTGGTSSAATVGVAAP